MKIRMLIAGLCLALATPVFAERNNPNTDWFRDAGWGVFVHYLWDLQNAGNRANRQGKTTDWDTCVKEFDTEKFAEQVKETGARYVVFTMMQRTRHLIAPNATYDKLTGYKPGEACATRDLVEDLYQSLNKRGIVLMLYWTGDGPRQDAQAAKAMGGPGLSDEYVRNWANVAAEYSRRYGDKVRGWWVDGCYTKIGYNQDRWGILAAGLKAGNPRAIVALNNPAMTHANSSTDHEDFTTGEVNSFLDVPDTRWRGGKQFHILSFLGGGWAAPGVRYKSEFMTDYVGAVIDGGGVVSVDVCLYRDGSLDKEQLQVLKEMHAGLTARAKDREPWKTKQPIPAGNLASWKPAKLLSLDGKHPLPMNGAGGKLYLGKCGVDGDPDTGAQVGGTFAWTYEVDLVDAAVVDRAGITFGKNAYATHFQLQLSEDRERWQTVAEVQNQAGSQWNGKFAPVRARYVRVSAHKPNGPNQPGGQMNVAELEVYQK